MWCDTEVLIPLIMNETDSGCHGYKVIFASEQQNAWRQACYLLEHNNGLSIR